ncbi:MAG: hypothetical protein KDB07_13700 [Planctomycetes bacterium]|nr:hypothetical protein [Planctomycetota bacterium]
MESRSLYSAAYHEAERFRDEVVDRLGNALSDDAIREWNRERWWRWVSDRVIQHVRGNVMWQELSSESFASVGADSHQQNEIIGKIEAIKSKIGEGGLLSFEEVERLGEEWADLINRLLA